jgi:uncharacterized protein (TIGR02246 family)
MLRYLHYCLLMAGILAACGVGRTMAADTNVVKTTVQDEQAIRASAAAFVKAFNTGDAKAVGALYAPDAVYTDEAGQRYHGRAAIQKLYADLFARYTGATMTVTIESLRFMSPTVAIERGVAKLHAANILAGTGARYSAVHIKRNGAWCMQNVRDSVYVAGSHQEHLQDLAWMIGTWTGTAENAGTRCTFVWLADTNFIQCTYSQQQSAGPPLTGMQVIGWDAAKGQIVSWQFDAQGGVANDVWMKSGAVWIIDAEGRLPDGGICSAVNILTHSNATTFTWQSVRRTLDGVRLPNTPLATFEKVQSGN